jgi:DNA-binding NtrC family response regulator
MATVLIIDKESEKIAEQFKLIKGIFISSVQNIDDAESFLKSDQFDVVICDHYLLGDNDNFFDYCLEVQPLVANYLIINHDTDESKLNIQGVTGFLKRPIHPGQINSLSVEELLDQREIDTIFD